MNKGMDGFPLAQDTPDRALRIFQIKVFSETANMTTGDNKFVFAVSEDLNSATLVRAEAFVSTSASSATVTVPVRNVTKGVDMLVVPITIDALEFTSYTADVRSAVDYSNNTVETGDRIAIDVDVAGAGSRGLGVILTFQQA